MGRLYIAKHYFDMDVSPCVFVKTSMLKKFVFCDNLSDSLP